MHDYEIDEATLRKMFSHMSDATKHTIYNPPPLAAAINELRAEVDRLRRALARIAVLDAERDSNRGDNEWGQAHCFRQAQGIAAEALK